MESDCDADEEDFGLTQTLPVAKFKTYDPEIPPACGQDYLRRVQLEARNCPDIVVADIQIAKETDMEDNVFSGQSNGFIKCVGLFSVEWQREQISDFSRLRLKVFNVKAKYFEKCQDSSKLESTANVHWWRKHCCGVGVDKSADESVHRKPGLPLLKTLLRLSQNDIHQLLSYHIKWISEQGFNYHKGLWIYSLLACLEKPLQSEVYSTLRDLSRILSQTRSKLAQDSEELISLFLLICIIGRYFGQLDMIDED